MSVSQLRQITGLPILGSVSMKANAAQSEKNKKEALRYSLAALGLFMFYIGFMTIDILEIKQLSLFYFMQKIH
jgi:hypothetical protein